MKPGDFTRHGFTQGCPGCIYAQTSIGPERNHNEACRDRMESEIAKDETDKRAEKVKERQDHYVANKIQQDDIDKGVNDPREEVAMEPEQPDVPMEDDILAEEPLVDAPIGQTDVRLKSPERKKAIKRSVSRHDEEPEAKKLYFYNFEADMESVNDGIDVDSLAARKWIRICCIMRYWDTI